MSTSTTIPAGLTCPFSDFRDDSCAGRLDYGQPDVVHLQLAGPVDEDH